jgi:hypothetical protein
MCFDAGLAISFCANHFERNVLLKEQFLLAGKKGNAGAIPTGIAKHAYDLALMQIKANVRG